MLAAALVFCGCTSSHPVALDPAGPAPTTSAPETVGQGTLVVFSRHEAVANISAENSGQPSDDWEYSGYKILSTDGKRIKTVSNNAGTVQLHPKKIELPAGKYVVVARAGCGLRVTVPIVIFRQRTTVLRLDENDFQPGENGFNQTNAVVLLDGRIAGWQATAENEPPF